MAADAEDGMELRISKCAMLRTEEGIYKRKQESKKTRKHAFDQESKKKKGRKRFRPRKRPRKKEKIIC